MDIIQDRDQVSDAYEDVRNDSTSTSWVLLCYEEKNIKFHSSGEDYNQLLSQLTDDERMFGYVRMEVGDEMSKRAKFALITWVGSGVSAMKKAKLSTDKALVKNIFKSFAIEVMTDEMVDLSEESLKLNIKKAGGANYGVGVAPS